MKNLIFLNQSLELCGIPINSLKKIPNILASYRPPNPSLSQNEWDILIKDMSPNCRTLLVGDFNDHSQAWNCRRNNTDGSRFYNSLIDSNLFLHNNNTLTQTDL